MAICLGKGWTAWCGQVRAAEAQPCPVRGPPPRANTGFRSRVQGGAEAPGCSEPPASPALCLSLGPARLCGHQPFLPCMLGLSRAWWPGAHGQ